MESVVADFKEQPRFLPGETWVHLSIVTDKIRTENLTNVSSGLSFSIFLRQ
jgi:hypothetical protein